MSGWSRLTVVVLRAIYWHWVVPGECAFRELFTGNDGAGSDGVASGEEKGCIRCDSGALGGRVGKRPFVEGDPYRGGVFVDDGSYAVALGIAHGKENAHGVVRDHFVLAP